VRRLAPGLALVLALVPALAAGCAGTPPLADRYRDLDSEGKAAFLAYYPLLKPEERLALIDSAGGSETWLRAWALEDADLRKRLEPFPAFKGRKRAHRVVGMDVAPAKEGAWPPIRGGTRVELRATARWADGRSADVTEDSTWSVEPPVARMDGAALEFGCLASDVTVTADFLRERTGSLTVPIRKSLKELRVKLAESHHGMDGHPYLRFTATAVCDDGTETDVSCQADWGGTDPRLGRLVSCGNFRTRRGADLDDVPFRVEARYGERAGSLHSRLPRRF
jgi:hypothetical protein